MTYRETLLERLRKQKEKGRKGGRYKRSHVVKAQKERSLKAKETDNALQAEVTDDYNLWLAHPDEYDVVGVDYFPVPTVKGDRELNYSLLEHSMREYYGVDPNHRVKAVFHDSGDSFEEVYGHSAVPYAFYRVSTDTIHFSPRASRLLNEGVISNKEDFWAFGTIVHEYEHAINSTRENTGTAFEEGSTEILSKRYAFMAYQMNPKLRDKLKKEIGTAYAPSTYAVGAIALIHNNYDEEKAIKWLKDVRSAKPSEQKKMLRKAEKDLIKQGYFDDISKKMRSSDYYKNKSEKHWSNIEEIRAESNPLYKKLGISGQGGILYVSSGKVDEEEMFKRPELSDDAYRWMDLSDQEDEEIEKAHTASRKSKKILEEIDDSKKGNPFHAHYDDITFESPVSIALTNNLRKVALDEYTITQWWIDV